MNKFLQILVLAVSLTIMVSCRSNGNRQSIEPTKTTGDRLEVLYFHGAYRCPTCKAIQSNTESLLDSLYHEQKKEGKIVYRVLDISKNENSEIAEKYEVTWSSLYLNLIVAGDESVNNLTEFGFANARINPDGFKKGLQFKIDSLLNII